MRITEVEPWTRLFQVARIECECGQSFRIYASVEVVSCPRCGKKEPMEALVEQARPKGPGSAAGKTERAAPLAPQPR